jgi:hypothetical protein
MTVKEAASCWLLASIDEVLSRSSLAKAKIPPPGGTFLRQALKTLGISVPSCLFCADLKPRLRQPQLHLRPQLWGRRAAPLAYNASMLPNARGEHWVSNDGCQEENWHAI